MRHTNLGQQGGGGGKDGGEYRPSNPAHVPYGTRRAICAESRLHCDWMETGRASKTASRVAIRRAAHQLMDQPCGARSIPLQYAWWVRGLPRHGARDAAQWRGTFAAFMAARSRFAEDQLADAVARGMTQYVVWAPDSTHLLIAIRFPRLRVFEVDFPATQEWKRSMLRGGRHPVPRQSHVCSAGL